MQSYPFGACHDPNDVWCIDFKGWFLTGDGTHVEPLTLSDRASRYLLLCEAVGRGNEAHVWPALEAAFRAHDLPKALRSDNGPPFASRAVGGLSRLTVKLIKAGIRPERIEPGKPQQNGRHERMHLTLKQDTASPPAHSLKDQIERFSCFQKSYNEERPHEALGQIPPAQVYRPSPRRYDGVLHSSVYDIDCATDCAMRRARTNGQIKWRSAKVFISEVMTGEPVGSFGVTKIFGSLRMARVRSAPSREMANSTNSGRDRPNHQARRPPKVRNPLPMSPG